MMSCSSQVLLSWWGFLLHGWEKADRSCAFSCYQSALLCLHMRPEAIWGGENRFVKQGPAGNRIKRRNNNNGWF